MTAYYNEIDPFCAQWLRNLIGADLIAKGEVDERSIADVQPDDVREFAQCHFFAGIGVWSHALRLARIKDNERIWTGSCPCQPFSVAGSKLGTADGRHLWPEFFRLIRECRPPIIFGEQVASSAALAWLDLVSDDLEGTSYAVGAADLCASCVGAPHIRQRLYWMANPAPGGQRIDGSAPRKTGHAPQCESIVGLGNADESRGWRDTGAVSCAQGEGDCERVTDGRVADESVDASAACGAGDASGVLAGFWSNADWLTCTDGKARPVEPGTFPLAFGATARVGRLRAYGNAIVAPLAAEFVRAAMECIP